MIEQSDIAHYLLSLGVVKPQEVIEEGFTVVDASRRNSVFLAATRAGPTFVVKQAREGDASSLTDEAEVLRLLAGSAVAEHVPAVVHHEPGGCLVLRTPGGARDWSEHGGRFSRARARALGRVVADLHRLPIDVPACDAPAWPLLLAAPPHELVLGLSAAAQDLVARIQASDFVCGRLDELGAAESDDALVHGDLRWENVLAVPAGGSRRRTRVLLADWESAGRADPALDVGSVLAEYLRAWVGSIPIVEVVDPGRLVASARYPLTAMRPAMDAFWSAYRGANPQGPALRRVIDMTAVRLLQTAIEVAQGLAAATAHVVTLLQLADNLLRRPDVAARDLLELRA